MRDNLLGQGRLEETKRVSRILALLQLITASPRRYSRRDLSARFEVSERMIQKDLEVIRHGLRLPLGRTREGYYFEKTPSLSPLQFNFAEALSLLLAIQAARQVSGIGSPELSAALARLETLLPREVVSLLRQAANPPALREQRQHRQQMLMLLNQALIEGRKVRIRYATHSRGGEINDRVVRPYHVMPYVRSWHLIAYCEWR
ncbi:MAG TPA: WYL domain-containing protein, partial [Desulfotomaculum sp.]|nr:WYL domain-containing protein [Desulfotomaculum sp.]